MNDVAPQDEPLVLNMSVLTSEVAGYLDTVRGVCEQLYVAQRATLETYWVVGALLHDLVVAQVADGDVRNVTKVIKQLSEDVHNVSGGKITYGDSSLRKMLDFRESFSEGQLHRMQDLGLPISKALPMCISDMTDQQRDEVITELETGSLESTAIPERVQELVPEEGREETRGGAGPFGTIKKLLKQVDKMCQLIEGDFTTLTAVVFNGDGTDEDQITDYKDKMIQFNNRLDSMRRLWDTQYNSYVVVES